MTTTAAPGGHSAPLGLMSCVRENSPQDMMPQTDLDLERNEPSKKRRFHPFRGLRKIFRRDKRVDDIPVESSPTLEPPADTGQRSRSTSELLVEEPRKKQQQTPGTGLGGGALSVSHDSVFTAEQRSTSSEMDTAQSVESLSIQQMMQQTGVRAELLDAVRRRGRGRGDTSEDEEDLGLPRSPCNSPTTTDKALKDHPTKSHSTCSDGSLLSMGSSEMDEDSFGQHSRHSSKLSLHDRRPSQTTNAADSELELGASSNATPLSHSAARHKMSVRPKRTHGAPRRRRTQQVIAGSALPTTPEVNEEISTRSLTPEGTTSRETISELYSTNSTSMSRVWSASSSISTETQLKSASLPPGLALASGVSRLSRSRSNARDVFVEEDEDDKHRDDKKKDKEESFFGRFLARRSGKKKKIKSEDTTDIIKSKSEDVETVKTEHISTYKEESISEKRTYSVDSGISKIPRSGPASRQRIQPIDIPASPDSFRHKRQQQIDLDLPPPPANSSPNEPSFIEKPFLPETKVMPSLEKEIPVPTPRTILPTKPEVIPSVRTILPQSYSPPNGEVVPAPRNLPKSVEDCKMEIKEIKTESSQVEECKTKVKITGLSSYQQRVLSYNDELDNFKSLDETSDDSIITLSKSHSFRSKPIPTSGQDHSSLPFTVNSSIYDSTNSDSETFTDSLMSTTTTQSDLPQVSVTIKKSTENISKESENEVKIINTNAETISDNFVKEEVKIKDFIEKKVTKIEESVCDKFEEKVENKDEGITISCVNSQMQASVNTKTTNQVIVSISNPEPPEITTETTSVSQVSVTKVQLKNSVKTETSVGKVPEFLKIQLNKVDAKPTTNVVLSTSNSFSKADQKQKSVLEIETDRENGEVDIGKRKFSTDDVEIIDKETSEEIVQVPSKNVSVTNLLKSVKNDVKPTLIISSQPRKSSLVSSTSSSSVNKSFLKKKSNSLELGDSIKMEETAKLASSADQLLTKTDNKEKSFDMQESCEVVMRKKSVVSQKKDNDEPELMKVFARRSLKLKDSEAETLSQQVLVLVEDNQKQEAAENNKRDSDKENEGSESPVEERRKSKEIPKNKEPLSESKFVETADVTLRKPSSVLNNKLSVFGGSKYQRTVSLSTSTTKNEDEEEKRRHKSFIEPKTEKKPVITNYRSSHIINEIKKSDIKTKSGDEIITSSLKKDFENEDYVPRFKRIQQRKEEWEQRAQQNMKKT